jgi:hypothetical protein
MKKHIILFIMFIEYVHTTENQYIVANMTHSRIEIKTWNSMNLNLTGDHRSLF